VTANSMPSFWFIVSLAPSLTETFFGGADPHAHRHDAIANITATTLPRFGMTIISIPFPKELSSRTSQTSRLACVNRGEGTSASSAPLYPPSGKFPTTREPAATRKELPCFFWEEALSLYLRGG